ncbi:MAG: recombinase RecA [Thermoprotei archaeon]|nr:MAG: recombinase RecA [Thermoprotei archaeon]
MVMAQRRSCDKCFYYLPSVRYCTKLEVIVSDPSSPPCLMPMQRASPRPVASAAKIEEAPSKPQPPSSSDEFVPTGIDGLDEILSGGFLRGKTYLIAGETGTGKTIFSLQFLIHGALNGEPGVYLAIDEPTEHLLRGVRRFGWSIVDELIEKRRLLFLDMRTHFSRIYLRDEKRRIEPRFVIEQILKNVDRIGAKRLVIDPIAPLMYGGSGDVLQAREFLREMVFALERRRDVTTIMTSEIPTGSKQLSRFGVEEFLATGIIMLGLEEINGRIYRVMFIRKARWSPVRPSKYVFEIVRAKGIVLKGPIEQVYRSGR